MPQSTNTPSTTNVFLYGSNADATNTSTLYAPAELGQVFYNQNQKYQRVQLDSGATSANAVGVVAVGQVAFWVSKLNKIVSNDQRMALGGTTAASRNAVAGIFRIAATAGNYVDICQKGNGVSVASDGAGAIGGIAVADATASTARVTAVTIGTAPTVMGLGVIRAAAANNLITVDIDIPSVD